MDPNESNDIVGITGQTAALLARIPSFMRVERCLAFYGDDKPSKFYLTLRSVFPSTLIDSFGPYEKESEFLSDDTESPFSNFDKMSTLLKEGHKYDLMIFMSEKMEKRFISQMRSVIEKRLMRTGLSLFATKRGEIEKEGPAIFSHPRYKVTTSALDMTASLYPTAFTILGVMKKY